MHATSTSSSISSRCRWQQGSGLRLLRPIASRRVLQRTQLRAIEEKRDTAGSEASSSPVSTAPLLLPALTAARGPPTLALHRAVGHNRLLQVLHNC